MFVSRYNLRKKLHLASDDRTGFCVDTYMYMYIENIEWSIPETVNGPLTQKIVYSLPMSNRF